ncbi:MAG TPA: S8 family serine peptidase, partial [Candidatus Limnocylindria bacterium]|nr:S8 family serine peptidase [Candidatus Limnocylindria bacterium]
DVVNNDSNAADDNGHGTWVAGVIAANTNNGIGISGISWSDRILPVKVMGADGLGTTSNLAFGIRWAADRGAKVINMSVGGFPQSSLVQESVNYAWSKGAVLVGAAGNNRALEEFYPASFPNVVSVSATQEDDEFANWSSYGPKVDVSAPGASILTTDCTGCPASPSGSVGYAYVSGTSFATPNTSAVVALIQARYPSMTNQQVVDRLLATVDDLGYPGWDNRYGRGRVNAARGVGVSVASPARRAADGLEPNDGWSSARQLPLGKIVYPSIYPAGDADHFFVDAPRAGRVDVAVTAITDTSRVPKSALPVDPILELYNAAGGLLGRIDNATDSSATEYGGVSVSGAERVLIRVANWFPNANWSAYTIRATWVDTVAPRLASRSPAPNAVNVPFDGAVTVTFDEPVSGVGTGSFVLRDAASRVVPATVTYDAATRRATLRPSAPLAGEAPYAVALSSSIVDGAGNRLAYVSWGFTTGKAHLRTPGRDRYEGAAALSAMTFAPGVPVAVLTSGENFPDALAGAPLAVHHGAPILLVRRDLIPSATAAELTRLRPGRIIILGGSGSVGSVVASQAAGYTGGGVTRIGGADRYSGAANISAATFASGIAVAYVASGENFPDALAGAAVAAGRRSPVLLVRRDAIPSATAAELSRLKPGRIVVLGGPATVSDGVLGGLDAFTAGSVTRVPGDDRYSAAAALSAQSFPADGPASAFVTTGENFPDALTAAAVAGREGAPVLLVRSDRLPSEVGVELRRLSPSRIVTVGGPASVGEAVRSAIRALWP